MLTRVGANVIVWVKSGLPALADQVVGVIKFIVTPIPQQFQAASGHKRVGWLDAPRMGLVEKVGMYIPRPTTRLEVIDLPDPYFHPLAWIIWVVVRELLVTESCSDSRALGLRFPL